MNLPYDPSQWDYSDPEQRILIAERARAMLDALANNTPMWLDKVGAEREALAIKYASFTNARVEVDRALRYMRNAQASPEFRRGTASPKPGEPGYAEAMAKAGFATPAQSTATAAHSCSACGRHPDTHRPGGWPDGCAACGLGEEK